MQNLIFRSQLLLFMYFAMCNLNYTNACTSLALAEYQRSKSEVVVPCFCSYWPIYSDKRVKVCTVGVTCITFCSGTKASSLDDLVPCTLTEFELFICSRSGTCTAYLGISLV